MAKRKSKKTGKYVFPQELPLQETEKFKENLLTLLKDSSSAHELEMEACERIELAALQVFVAYVKEVKSKSIDLTVKGPLHPNLSQQLEDLDLLKISGNQAFLFHQLEEGGVNIEF